MIFICAKNCQINPMNGRAKLPVISGHAQPNRTGRAIGHWFRDKVLCIITDISENSAIFFPYSLDLIGIMASGLNTFAFSFLLIFLYNSLYRNVCPTVHLFVYLSFQAPCLRLFVRGAFAIVKQISLSWRLLFAFLLDDMQKFPLYRVRIYLKIFDNIYIYIYLDRHSSISQ